MLVPATQTSTAIPKGGSACTSVCPSVNTEPLFSTRAILTIGKVRGVERQNLSKLVNIFQKAQKEDGFWGTSWVMGDQIRLPSSTGTEGGRWVLMEPHSTGKVLLSPTEGSGSPCMAQLEGSAHSVWTTWAHSMTTWPYSNTRSNWKLNPNHLIEALVFPNVILIPSPFSEMLPFLEIWNLLIVNLRSSHWYSGCKLKIQVALCWLKAKFSQ